MKKCESYWRSKARPIIDNVLAETKGRTEQEIRRALYDAYPFGERKYHPYKIWLDEIQRQRGIKWPIGHKRAWENSKKRATKEQQKLAEWESLYGRHEVTA